MHVHQLQVVRLSPVDLILAVRFQVDSVILAMWLIEVSTPLLKID